MAPGNTWLTIYRIYKICKIIPATHLMGCNVSHMYMKNKWCNWLLNGFGLMHGLSCISWGKWSIHRENCRWSDLLHRAGRGVEMAYLTDAWIQIYILVRESTWLYRLGLIWCMSILAESTRYRYYSSDLLFSLFHGRWKIQIMSSSALKCRLHNPLNYYPMK